MDGKRRVEVRYREGRWFAWTDDGLIVWFDSESDARGWAVSWSYRARPAEAVLLDGASPHVISSY